MTVATKILRAPHIGIRKLRNRLSWFLKHKSPIVITDRGIPADVILPYSDVVEIIELLDEATDYATLQAVKEGREAIRSGARGIPVSRVLNKIREHRK